MIKQREQEQADLDQQTNNYKNKIQKKMAKTLTFAIFCSIIEMVGKINKINYL